MEGTVFATYRPFRKKDCHCQNAGQEKGKETRRREKNGRERCEWEVRGGEEINQDRRSKETKKKHGQGKAKGTRRRQRERGQNWRLERREKGAEQKQNSGKLVRNQIVENVLLFAIFFQLLSVRLFFVPSQLASILSSFFASLLAFLLSCFLPFPTSYLTPFLP